VLVTDRIIRKKIEARGMYEDNDDDDKSRLGIILYLESNDPRRPFKKLQRNAFDDTGPISAFLGGILFESFSKKA
jgi:hypothetical protein